MAKNLLITVRVDESDRALFNEAARSAGVSLSVYARDALFARMALESGPVVDVREEAAALPEDARRESRPASAVASSRSSKPCRHGLTDCRTCRMGRYA